MIGKLYFYFPACGICVDDAFLAYKTGIFSSDNECQINHELALVGYGKDQATGEEYWVGRNSWGTYWGEQGFFKIRMHGNNNRIEEACRWGLPGKVEWQK